VKRTDFHRRKTTGALHAPYALAARDFGAVDVQNRLSPHPSKATTRKSARTRDRKRWSFMAGGSKGLTEETRLCFTRCIHAVAQFEQPLPTSLALTNRGGLAV
jgi:hypothetical protein